MAPPIWLFDLDNTLHNASASIFAQIDHRMGQSIQDLLHIDHQEADYLRRKYWLRYGATLIGLVKHHGIDAADFLHRSHDFNVIDHLHSESTLSLQLRRLPGQKIIFTNAPANYANRVLDALDIRHLFAQIMSIENMQLQQAFKPKPSAALMRQTLAKLKVEGAQCVFVDDTLRNLKAAYQLGIKTVHFAHPATPFSSRYAGRAAYIDLRVQSIQQLANEWHQLEKPDYALPLRHRRQHQNAHL